MKRGGTQLVQKAMSIKLDEKYIHCFRDLTRFDWQINRELAAEYAQHQRKRMQKQREKVKLERKYQSMQLIQSQDDTASKISEITDQIEVSETDSVTTAASKSPFSTFSSADSRSVSVSNTSSECDDQ